MRFFTAFFFCLCLFSFSASTVGAAVVQKNQLDSGKIFSIGWAKKGTTSTGPDHLLIFPPKGWKKNVAEKQTVQLSSKNNTVNIRELAYDTAAGITWDHTSWEGVKKNYASHTLKYLVEPAPKNVTQGEIEIDGITGVFVKYDRLGYTHKEIVFPKLGKMYVVDIAIPTATWKKDIFAVEQSLSTLSVRTLSFQGSK